MRFTVSSYKPMEVMAVCGSWILCVGALLASPVRSELSILGCQAGSVDVVEGTDQLFTCGEYSTEGPLWTVYGDKGRQLYSGYCNGWSCTPWNDKFQLHEVDHEKSNNMFRSTLTIKNIKRDSARQVVCSYSSTRASCNLRIITPAILKDCDVYIRDWQVHATCVVEHMYASDGMYWCTWRVNNVWFPSNFQDPLTEYWLNTRVYRKGVCYANHTMLFLPGNYTYSIKIDPGVRNTVKTLEIAHPGDPVHTCSDIVQEGSTVSCKCFSSNPGTPPADFFWNGLNNDTLFVKNVQREQNGNTHTCSMTWGPNGYIRRQAFLTLTVVVGPSVTYISSSEETFGDETKTVLVCTASDVYPSALFRWNISCENETQNETTSSCTLPTSPVADQVTIECTARNQIFPQVSSTTIYVLKPTRELTYTDNPYQGGVIAGSVVAVLLLVVIVAVIILFIKRRKVINKPETQTPTVRFAAPSGDIYTIVGTTTGDHREDEYVTVRDTTCSNNILQPQTPVVRFAAPSGDLYSIAGPATAREVNQATIEGATGRMQHKLPCHQTQNTTYHNNQGTESKKMPVKPKPTRLGEKSRLHWSSKAEFDNKVDTQSPAAHFAAPSGDLYAIAGPATAGKDKPVTQATSSTSYTPKSSSGHKARDISNMTNKGMDSKKMAIKPKPTRFGKKSRQDVPVTGYMNVTQVPTDSGLGVYHVVPWAAKSETGSSDARVLDTSTISEDEYNVLRFQEDRTGQEDHAVTYSHLNIK